MLTEIRHALRRLRATPLVTLSAIACLAIGVWMTCILTALSRGYFRPDLNIPQADRVVQLDAVGLFTRGASRADGRMTSSAVVDSLSHSPLFAAVGEYSYSWSSVDDRQRGRTSLSSGMMRVLGVRPYLGRGLLPSDDTTQNVVILSYQIWRSVYGGDSSVIGRRIYLDRRPQPLTIVGVMRADFMFPMHDWRPDFYTPVISPPGKPRYPVARMLGRLADGVTLDQARAVAGGVVMRNARADRAAMTEYVRRTSPTRGPPPLPDGPVLARLDRYYNEPLDPSTTRLFILILACGFAVVGVAAANVTNLLLVRGASRRQEIAVRMALGAARIRVIRELLVETGLVASVGIVIGYLVAAWQWSRLDPGFAARHVFGEVSGAIALVAVAAGLVLTLSVGIWPGIRATSMRLEEVLRDSRRSGVGSSPLEGVLSRMVAASTAATVMLLINAVLLTLSARETADRMSLAMQNLFTTDLNFQDDALAQRNASARDAMGRLRGAYGVMSAALGFLPGNAPNPLIHLGTAGQPDTRTDHVDVNIVSDGYFKTLHIPLLYGREFSPREMRDSTGSVVVSRALAQQLFPAGTAAAVGQRFRFRRNEDPAPVELTVVGVAQSVAGGGGLALYLPMGASVPVQTTALIQILKDIQPDIVTALRPVEGITATTLIRAGAKAAGNRNPRRYLSIGFTMFSVVALILAAVGTYGVVAYSVLRRTHEIGVRMALGAERRRVTWMIVEQGFKVSLIGVIGGLFLSFAATKVIGGFIQDVNMDYPLAIGGVILFVSLISLAASAIPGYRAGRLNPVDALRAE